MFISVLTEELANFQHQKDSFIKVLLPCCVFPCQLIMAYFAQQEFSAEDYDAIVSGWTAKLERCGDGQQKWGLFVALKA